MKDVSSQPRNLCFAVSFVGVLLLILGTFIMKAGNCSAMVPTVAAALTVVLLGLLGAGRCAFAQRQAIEESEAEAFRKEHGKSELFDDADESVRMATRANTQYLKYFVPIFTFALGIGLILFSIGVWRHWRSMLAFPQALNPMPLAILSICCAIGTLIAGSFFVGASREKGCRWLRPAGAWLFFSCVLFLGSGVALFLEYFKKAAAEADITVARVALFMLLVLAVELLLSFVIEFYRPRMPGEEERPLPESRLLALFTEPGGVARNVAASLDYQFGFQVSEVWFYRFLERTVAPLLALMLVTLWLQTCLVVISTEENGIHERFGRVVSQEALKPGLYFKLPAPFSRINRFPVDHVQEISVGSEHKHGDAHGDAAHDGHKHDDDKKKADSHDARVILWSSAHADEEMSFIVATTPEGSISRSGLDVEGRGAPTSVGLISAHIPLYFKVKNLYEYMYLHRDPGGTLKNIATRELLSFLAGEDFWHVLGPRRFHGGELLEQRIQSVADELQLGIEVVFVGLAGLHPPVAVGGAFDNVVAAREQQYERELKGLAYAVSREPQARSEAVTMVDQAQAYKQERESVSAAEAERFDRQLKSYNASPELFKLDSFLGVLDESGQKVRKYVLTNEQNREVLILNLEKKLRSSLLDLNLDNTP
jgi:membrane protease subunit HflK